LEKFFVKQPVSRKSLPFRVRVRGFSASNYLSIIHVKYPQGEVKMGTLRLKKKADCKQP
jgi:hypothetical protein